MKGNTPKQRAKSLQTVLNKTYDRHGEWRNVIDVLTDIRHLCDMKNWDFAELDRVAYSTHYLTEKATGTVGMGE